MTKHSPFRYFKTSPEIIRLAMVPYIRLPLSLRRVEDLLHESGIAANMKLCSLGRTARLEQSVRLLICLGLAQSRFRQMGFERSMLDNKNNWLAGGDGVDAALSPTASQCAKLVMLKSQGKREGIHEGN
jgi:hypothetical protein